MKRIESLLKIAGMKFVF